MRLQDSLNPGLKMARAVGSPTEHALHSENQRRLFHIIDRIELQSI